MCSFRVKLNVMIFKKISLPCVHIQSEKHNSRITVFFIRSRTELQQLNTFESKDIIKNALISCIHGNSEEEREKY